MLAKYASDNLRVYAVWLPMLYGDARDKWDGTDMPDVRVRHLWDGERVVGSWFSEHFADHTWRQHVFLAQTLQGLFQLTALHLYLLHQSHLIVRGPARLLRQRRMACLAHA